MSEHDVALIKQMRRELLTTMNLFYPGDASFESICSVLPLMDEHHLKRDVQYFVDRGYLSCTNPRVNQPWSERKFKLTDRGVDAALRVDKDKSLEP